MKQNERDQLSARLRRGAVAIVVSGATAAAAVNANPSGAQTPAWCTDRPTLVRQTGEAMFVHDMIDDGTLIYIEPTPGAWPVTIDLTHPARLNGEGSAELDASGPFESFFPFGNQAEIVWLRRRAIATALSRADNSNVGTAQAQSLQGPIALPDIIDGFTFAVRGMQAPGVRDYRSIEPVNLQELDGVFDVKRVRAKMSDAETEPTP
jgi:hypothetical protein